MGDDTGADNVLPHPSAVDRRRVNEDGSVRPDIGGGDPPRKPPTIQQTIQLHVESLAGIARGIRERREDVLKEAMKLNEALDQIKRGLRIIDSEVN